MLADRHVLIKRSRFPKFIRQAYSAGMTRFCTFLIGACLNIALLAADWPEFRGPTGQGLSDAKNVPVIWNATSNVAWQTPTPGKGWSSPVISAGKIFLTTALTDGAEISLRVLSLVDTTG